MKTKELIKLEKEIAEYYHPKGKKIVFGEGDPDAKIMLIGEAPGAQEVKLGRPFVGQAGKNLDSFLDIIKLQRAKIYITSPVKFRPIKINPKSGLENNRRPTETEIQESLPSLLKQIDIIEPKILVTLGNVPLQALTGDIDATIGENHGKYQKVTLLGKEYFIFPLYHPASIIYRRELKETYLQDLEKLRDFIAEQGLY